MLQKNKETEKGSNFSIVCAKLAKSGSDLALAVEKEDRIHKEYINAVDIRDKVQSEYHKIKSQIDTMAGL